MKYTTTEDKQLWVVRTESWEIPVFATPITGEDTESYWLVSPAASIGRMDMLILCGAIQPFSKLNERERWIVPHGTLEKLGFKAPGITPRFYLKQIGEAPKETVLEEEEQPEAPSFNDELVRTCWTKSPIAKIGVFQAVWSALLNEIAKRLLVDRQPVDLGWFVLHALPYRTNWKHNLLSKHPKLPAILNNSAEQRRIAMNIHGVTPSLTMTDMMATKGTTTGKTIFRWAIEVETKPAWDEYQEKVEIQRLRAGTEHSYLQKWGTIVRDSRKSINALLVQFCKSLSYSAGQPLENPRGGTHRLVPYIPSKGGKPGRVDGIDLPLVVDSCPTEVRGPSDPENAYRPTKKVRELPVLRLDLSDLRNTGGSGSD